jgi:AAHS family 4-hydroxybenzoate transporter-like MFS transporter
MPTRISPLDSVPFSAFQFWSVVLAASLVVLDGLDSQMLGIAAPSLIRSWAISRDSLGLVFALGFVGMICGNLMSGWIGDRFGRRTALVFGVLVFGLASLLTGFATNLEQVAVLRILAGVGLGGTPGTAAALICELTPARFRSVAVIVSAVCVSFGGILGGLAASAILPHLDWRWLFYVGGVAPLVAAVAAATLLPESPSFLASRPARVGELRSFLAAIHYPGSVEEFRESARDISLHTAATPSTRTLIAPPQLRDTVALSIALFTGMFMIYLMFNWVPTLLYSNGFPPASASIGLTSFNSGGVFGAIFAAALMMRCGSRRTLIPLDLAGVAVCVTLAMLSITGVHDMGKLLVALGAMGLSASAAQSALWAVGTHAFPTEVRARGLGLIGAAGRAGAIASALLGATLTRYGNTGFFGTLAVLLLINTISVALVRNHVPPLPSAPLPS